MAGKEVVRNLLIVAVRKSHAVASAVILAGYLGLFLLPLASRKNVFDENSLLVHNTVPDIWYVRFAFCTLCDTAG
jgi:hypothetical protein